MKLETSEDFKNAIRDAKQDVDDMYKSILNRYESIEDLKEFCFEQYKEFESKESELNDEIIRLSTELTKAVRMLKIKGELTNEH